MAQTENKIYTRPYACSLIDWLEDWSDEKGITVPNDEHEGDENEANIYGSDFDQICSAIEGVLADALSHMRTGTVIVTDQWPDSDAGKAPETKTRFSIRFLENGDREKEPWCFVLVTKEPKTTDEVTNIIERHLQKDYASPIGLMDALCDETGWEWEDDDWTALYFDFT